MDIQGLRKKIDVLDTKIVELLNQRAEVTQDIGKQKLKDNASVYAPAREKQVLDRVKALSKGALNKESLEAIYREIMSASLALEKTVHIAALGKKGAYTFSAAKKIFGEQVTYESCQDIPEVFRRVESGECDQGVLPIENSTEGMVTPTVDLLVDSELKICRQVLLPIKHNLLSKTTITKIKKVYSNPQVFNQCRHWLSQNMPSVGLIEVASTTEAAEIASREKDSAALASIEAAKENKLDILVSNISDLAHNTTRFCVIGANSAAATGADRTSLVFSIKDRVGALHAMLTPFYTNKINLTKIESRPSKKKAWDYYFFIDLEGHQDDPHVKRALAQLEGMCKFMKILGSYPVIES
ncbi:MAG: prephenate dehydratase [Candidatus Omnitrophota bacterium]